MSEEILQSKTVENAVNADTKGRKLLNMRLIGLTIGVKIITSHNFIVSNNFPDYIIIFRIAELVSNSFLGYVISCVVAKHTMWTSDYIT